MAQADVQEADAVVGRWRAATAARAHRRPERSPRALHRPSGSKRRHSSRDRHLIAPGFCRSPVNGSPTHSAPDDLEELAYRADYQPIRGTTSAVLDFW
jgi:hypothetical protein